MTERYTEGPEVLVPPDPELAAVGDRLQAVSEVLGFTETDAIAELREQFMREMNLAGHFDRDNPVHVDHLGAYQDAAQASLADNPRPEAAIGYHLMMARLWLEADDPGRFYDYMYGYEDDPRDRGAITMLRDTPGLEETYEEVQGTLEYLESLNQD